MRRVWCLTAVGCALPVEFFVWVYRVRTDFQTMPTAPVDYNRLGLEGGSDGAFVTSVACRDCHADQYASLHASFHRNMKQRASSDTIAAPLRPTRLQSRRRTFVLAHEGGKLLGRHAGSRLGTRAAVTGERSSADKHGRCATREAKGGDEHGIAPLPGLLGAL